jgi:hypothetical protein
MGHKITDWDQTKYLPPQANSMPELNIVKALRSAWIKVLNFEPTINSLAVLFAQITLECGPNLKYCKWYNCGNIKSLPNDGRCWTAFRCNEIINGVNQYYDPPNPICNFRAFKTPEEGFVDYIQFLAQKKNYAKAWQEVINGNPATYVHQLKAAWYFTATEESYLKGVVSIFNQFIKKYGNLNLTTQIALVNDKEIEPELTPEERAHFQGQLALTLFKNIETSRTAEDSDIDYSDANLTSPIPMPQTVWSSLKNIFGGKK